MATASNTCRAEPGLIGGKRKAAHLGKEEGTEVEEFCGSGAPGKVPRTEEVRHVSPSPSPPNLLSSRLPDKLQPIASGKNVAEVDVGGEEQENPAQNPLHSHDLIVATLDFLADGEVPSELLEISKSSKSFRAAALDNIIWKEMCDQKWKTEFGYQFRMERAKTDAERKDGGNDSEFDLSVSSSSEIRPYPPTTNKLRYSKGRLLVPQILE